MIKVQLTICNGKETRYIKHLLYGKVSERHSKVSWKVKWVSELADRDKSPLGLIIDQEGMEKSLCKENNYVCLNHEWNERNSLWPEHWRENRVRTLGRKLKE